MEGLEAFKLLFKQAHKDRARLLSWNGASYYWEDTDEEVEYSDEIRELFTGGASFEPNEHKYSHPLFPNIISVSGLIKKYQPEFPSHFISSRMATEERSQESILAEWEETKRKGLEYGTKIHKYAEDSLKLIARGIDLTNNDPQYQRIDECLYGQYFGWGRSIILQEQMLFDSSLPFVAGTSDMLMFRLSSDDELQVFIRDYKTNKKISRESKYRMLYPLTDTPSSDWHKYSLQISLYSEILNRKGVETRIRELFHVPLLESEEDYAMTIDCAYDIDDYLPQLFSHYLEHREFFS